MINHKRPSILKRGVNVIHSNGLRGFIRRFFLYIISPVFSITTYILYEIHIKRSIREIEVKINNCRLEIVSDQEQVDRLVEEGIDFSSDPDFINYGFGFNSGAFLCLVFIGQSLAHTSWFSRSHDGSVFDTLFSRINFGDAGYIGPCKTISNFRGLGIYPYALTSILKFLSEQYVYRALISTSNRNMASIRGIEKAGFNPFNVIKKYKLLIWNYFGRRVDIAR